MIAKRILVVDDSESTRYVISTWLRREGYDITEAATGQEALDIAFAGNIDIVVLDVNLPDMTGYDVCEAIKARESAIPVLHVSSTAVGASDRSEGLRRGADGFLTEPVERQVLVASVAALLRGAEAERTALRLAERLKRLNDASHAVNEARSLAHLASVIAEQACTLFDVPAVLKLNLSERNIIAWCEPGEQASVQVRARNAAQASTESIPSGEPVSSPLNLIDGQRGELQVHALETDVERAIVDETRLILAQFARAASTAVNNTIGRDIERRIALTLQHSLLPDIVGPIPDTNVAFRYQASDEHAEVGGDFYEVFVLDDTHIAFAVGDVAGHSIGAAAVMAQLRSAIRAYVLEGHGPAQTLERLDAKLQRFHPGVTASVCCALYNRHTGEGELANAGHPPALSISGTRANFHPLGQVLLGAATPGSRSAAPFTLKRGDRLVLYTDGLVERRKESIDDGMARLARVAAESSSLDIETLCDRILNEVGSPQPEDDVALVVIERPANETPD